MHFWLTQISKIKFYARGVFNGILLLTVYLLHPTLHKTCHLHTDSTQYLYTFKSTHTNRGSERPISRLWFVFVTLPDFVYCVCIYGKPLWQLLILSSRLSHWGALSASQVIGRTLLRGAKDSIRSPASFLLQQNENRGQPNCYLVETTYRNYSCDIPRSRYSRELLCRRLQLY